MLRSSTSAFLALCALSTLACQGGGHPLLPTGQAPAAAVELGQVVAHEGLTESAIGLIALEVDPEALSATVALEASRGLESNADVYELSLERFLKPNSFRVRSVTRTADALDVSYSFTHPFAAPSDPAGTPNASSNRADLGFAGRLAILADVATPTGNTYFTDVVANTALVRNPDGYYQPAGLLAISALANAFPYQMLVDESGPDGNREQGISNGGDPTGNFGSDGWTRDELGLNHDAWTGYGVLHQGQSTRSTLSLSLSELSGPTALRIAVLVKYNDPRQGANGLEKRGNRLPPISPDPTKFGYRMPHGALDVERVEFLGETGGFQADVISASTLRFRITDWDAFAAVTTASELALDSDLRTVTAGEPGAPALAVCIPGVLGDATVVETFAPGDQQDDDAFPGGDVGPELGAPGDALFYERSVTKPAGAGQLAGLYVGLARATDPEPAGVVIPVDRITLLPLTGNLPRPVIYQHFMVELTATGINLPPEATGTLGLKLQNPCMPSPATFVIENKDLLFSDPELDPITFTVVATPNVGAPIMVSNILSFPISNAATGPWTNPSATQVTFAVYANDAAHPGAAGTLLPVLTAPAPLVGSITIPSPWARVFGGASAIVNDLTLALNGDVYLCGYYSGTADLNPGAGVDSHPSAGNWDMYVSRLDPLGNFVWGRAVGGVQQDYCDALAVDASGNVYASGRFQESFDFDPGPGVATRSVAGDFSNDYDGFVWSLDANGAFRWASVFGSPSSPGVGSADWPFDIALDPAGNPTAVGRSDGLCDFDPGAGVQAPPTIGGSDSFMLTLNAVDGSFNRVLRFGSSASDNFSDIAYDTMGGLILTGAFNSTMDMDPGPGVIMRNAPLGAAPYFLKLDANSWSYIWDAVLETQIPQGQTYYGLTVDSAGDVYMSTTYAGGGSGDVDAGPGTAILPPVVGVWDAVLVAYSRDGEYKWHATVGGPNVDWGRAVIANDDTVFWGGGFTGASVDFDPGPGVFQLSAPGTSQDAYIASFESQHGCFQGAGRLGGNNTDEVYALTMANACDPLAGGWTQGTVDYDPGPGTQNLGPTGSFTAFALKLNGGTLAF